MKITVERKQFTEAFTLGELYADGERIGFTCEDADRKLEDGGVKQYGQTAIPRGLYKAGLSFSQRFKKVLPELYAVPGFTGIRIHGGNTADDSLGCILLGGTRRADGVANCAGPLARLITLMEQAEDIGEPITVEVL